MLARAMKQQVGAGSTGAEPSMAQQHLLTVPDAVRALERADMPHMIIPFAQAAVSHE